MEHFNRKVVYFEKQSNDRLCGVHCLNSLLQAPYFDPVTLSEIGLRLDEMERKLLGNDIEHANVDDDGNYNIQVLTEALKVYGCEVRPLKPREAISLLEKNEKVEGFIFNSSTHWYSIRKIDNIWFNLNSTNTYPGPEIISDFYLSAFIQGAEDIGYTNFLVTKLPRLPELNSQMYSNLQPYQRLVKYEDIIKARDSKKKKNQERDKEDKEKKEKEEDDKIFKAFQGKGYKIDEGAENNNMQMFEDDEMMQAYQLSIIEYAERIKKELPPIPEDGWKITICYNNNIYERRWRYTSKIKDLKLYVQSEIPTSNKVELFTPFPRTLYDNDELTLKDAGLWNNQTINAKLIKE